MHRIYPDILIDFVDSLAFDGTQWLKGQYKIGAMLLDLNDPTHVLHRSSAPILEPDESYENNGFKAGVVYPCGAIIKNETLFVYYGGADSYVCVASTNLNEFLAELKYADIAKIEPTVINKVI